MLCSLGILLIQFFKRLLLPMMWGSYRTHLAQYTHNQHHDRYNIFRK